MDKHSQFLIADELSKPLMALLLKAGLDLYLKEDKVLILRPGDTIPDDFVDFEKVVRPTNVMGLWAMELFAKDLTKES